MEPIFAHIIWNPDPVIFSVGPFSLKWYGLMWALSFILSYVFTIYFHRREGKDERLSLRLLEYLFIGGIIGARLGEVVFYQLDYFLAHPLEIFQVWKGGLASHGGAIGIVLAVLLFVRKHPQYSVWWILDRYAIMICFMGGLYRIGNLFNSEIVGKITSASLPWAFSFIRVDGWPKEGADFVWRHPSQLYSVLMVWTLFVLFFYLYRKGKFLGAGCFTGLYFVLAFSGRTFLEFFKANASTTQFLNLPLILIGLFLLFRCWNRSKSGSVNEKDAVSL